ncbi:MAG: cysteine synthase [Alphaproteobacteria bacterium HGW-Alphaproteobacteria-16]|nr:MAG: cysteine synthase [Alphaproteobacteria bacterium HGW-Alphaproteobacteria-16]
MPFDHIADAIKSPAIVRLGDNLFIARFETMKVYSTLAAVAQLLEQGRVRAGDTLLDSSSGIYAYALALACHKYGLKCHIVASKTVDRTLMVQLRILGATVEQVQSSPTLKMDQNRRVARIGELLASWPDMHWMRQYHDDIHYLGYEPVAQAILDTIGNRPVKLVGSVGSGCSTGGLIRALRCHDERTELAGIQPFGSVTFGSEHIEDPGIIIAGIGSSIPFRNVDHRLYDRMHWISFDHGLSGAVALLKNHAIFAGLSSGCSYLVALHEAARTPSTNVIFTAPDTGHRYVEPVFANHEQAQPLEALAPTEIERLEDLVLPWSAMQWGRRPYDDGRDREAADRPTH